MAPCGQRRGCKLPRYFLNQIHRGEWIPDPEGGDFPDMDAMKEELLISAREIMAERLLAGHELNHSRFEVKDEGGSIIYVMPFADALPRERE